MNCNYNMRLRVKQGYRVTAEEDIIAGCITAIHALQDHAVAQLSMNHYLILFYIFLHDGITRSSLIDQIPNAKKETIRRQVKELIEESGLLTETENEDVYRIKQLHLTENGHQIIQTVVQKMQDCATCLKDPNMSLSVNEGMY